MSNSEFSIRRQRELFFDRNTLVHLSDDTHQIKSSAFFSSLYYFLRWCLLSSDSRKWDDEYECVVQNACVKVKETIISICTACASITHLVCAPKKKTPKHTTTTQHKIKRSKKEFDILLGVLIKWCVCVLCVVCASHCFVAGI